MLRGFRPRLYQETILATAALKNTLVVLPTGMGKTAIALLLSAQRLAQYPNSKIIMVAPTKPLAEQHLKTFTQYFELPEDDFAVFTGAISPDKRTKLWQEKKIIFSTPQGLENDIISGKIRLDTVSLLVFDEAHRATGEYSYVFLAKQYLQQSQWPRILALTASPGSDNEKIQEVCLNLGIEAVEVRTDNDADVKPYIQDVALETIKVELPESFKKIQQLLNTVILARTTQLKELGVTGSFTTKKELLGLQRQLQFQMSRGERDYDSMKAISILAEIIKTHHALELIETQGAKPFCKYMTELFSQATSSRVKAVKNLTSDPTFKHAYSLALDLQERGEPHPKLTALKTFIKEEIDRNKNTKIILFTQFRDTAVDLANALKTIDGALPEVFVGQAKKSGTGLSQKQQVEMLDLFRDGMFNILIATSVAEEGLDIPRVDTVVFFEPIPSAIRHIQRRGRTGRQEKGRVVIFVTKNTRDEAYSWSAKHKEKRMIRVLENLKKTLVPALAPAQPTLQEFDHNVTIYADYREKSTGTVKALIGLGVGIKLEMLQSADYLLSSRVGIELKTAEDFAASIIDGRLLEQLKTLRRNFERPLLIIQGGEHLYSVRNIHPNAIRGMLGTIALSYNIPILHTKDEKDTAALLLTLAKREQEQHSRKFSPHADRKPMTLKEQQEYLVSALPSVGPALARELLKHFKTAKHVITATPDELKTVPGVGDKIAQAIQYVAHKEYEQ